MNKKSQFDIIINYLKTSSELKKFKYYDNFIKKWKKILRYYFENDFIFIQEDISDSDQFYHYEYQLLDTIFEFDFSIKFIRYLFYKNSRLFPIIELNYTDCRLMYDDTDCIYTYYDSAECKEEYSDIENIFVIPFPTNPLTHIVIDGNHRVSSLINAGCTHIKARYCSFEICERALFSAFYIAVYSCIFDCSFIKYNINKITDLQIKKHLKIFNEHSFVNNIDKRKLLD